MSNRSDNSKVNKLGSFLKVMTVVIGLIFGGLMVFAKVLRGKEKEDPNYGKFRPEQKDLVKEEPVQNDLESKEPVAEASVPDTSEQYVAANWYEKSGKRIADVTLSFLGLVILAPVFLVLSLAIVIDDPGPVLFTQRRVGIHKTYFKLHKFRSMKMCTPHDTPTHLLENPDQYITRVGHFLRKYSLDELPQIWDIFVGRISIVGPRPALWNQDDLIAERDRYGANDVMPGLTGYAQINGRDELEIPEKAKLDGIYTEAVRRGSLSAITMDLRCLLGTVFSVLRADGVVEGGTGEMNREKELESENEQDGENTIRKNGKKILLLVPHDQAIYKFRREFVEDLLAEGYEVHISTPFGDWAQDLQDLGCICYETTIDRHGTNPVKELLLLFFYWKLMGKVKPDVVITYTIKPNIYGGLAATLRCIPYYSNVTGLGIAIENGGLMQRLTLFLYKIGMAHAQAVIFQNEANLDYMKEHGVLSGKTLLVPGSGVNLKQHPLEPYPKDTEQVVFLVIGRIMRDKGVFELWEAAGKIRKKHPNVVFKMMGFYDDDMKPFMDEVVERGDVEYLGQQPEVHSFIRDSHATIQPSYHEGMSNVLLETAAAGRPVISTNIPGCREAFVDGVTGIGFEPRNSSALIDAIERFLALPRDEWEAMGFSGHLKMEDEFDRQKVVQIYMNEINSLLFGDDPEK